MMDVNRVELGLEQIARADRGAVDELLSVYEDPRAQAGMTLTLQPTVLVHEAHLRMVRPGRATRNGKSHLLLSGLTVQEVAETLGMSKRTVELDWNSARGWLRRALDPGGEV